MIYWDKLSLRMITNWWSYLILVFNIVQTMAEVQEHILYFIKVGQLTMAHMLQDQLLNQVQKVSTTKTSGMALENFSMLFHKFLNKDSDIVPEEAPLIVLDSKSAVCMYKNGKDTKHTRHISRRVHFVRNGKKWKMHKIEWCEGGLQLANIAITNVGDNELNTRMKYIMVRLDKWYTTIVK